MRRRVFLAGLVGSGLVACAPTTNNLALAPNSTLIVVRHADRLGEDLTEAGRARAEALVKAVDGLPLDAIHSPGIKRNLDTARPLAKARGMPIERIPAETAPQRLVASSAGRSVIWIGNSGNITAIWDALRLTAPPPVEYGDLHIVRADATGAVTIERRRFGAG
ncbi:histidine phosphatase family protein [Cognatishimia sp. F0-27]|uniref:histidine phosphatase family protein n=1 Tax=Cognatishimia sp. F0-27 TaxID=2816855 RepID=UPI001D0C2A4D|nr:histidine phosphatase family protein [Cognatishimia sp. F0-27]MCC1492071.1 histidine phosphatase family protein [Cognatishimia sp. F0-27]